MQTVAPLLAGLGFFFCGVHFVSTNLTPLAGRRFRYVLTRLVKWPWLAALTGTRYLGSSASAAAADGLDHWVALFAAAASRAVADAEEFEKRIAALEAGWRTQLAPVRRNSATDLLLNALPGAPILSVQAAASLIGRSVQAANEAVARLEETGILRQGTVGRRNRAFEAPQLIRAFTDLERQLASPTGDTRATPPARRVPRRH